jgi:hypothetical protein
LIADIKIGDTTLVSFQTFSSHNETRERWTGLTQAKSQTLHHLRTKMDMQVLHELDAAAAINDACAYDRLAERRVGAAHR